MSRVVEIVHSLVEDEEELSRLHARQKELELIIRRKGKSDPHALSQGRYGPHGQSSHEDELDDIQFKINDIKNRPRGGGTATSTASVDPSKKRPGETWTAWRKRNKSF